MEAICVNRQPRMVSPSDSIGPARCPGDVERDPKEGGRKASFGGWSAPVPISNLDALPSEQQRIEGPGARSDQGQGSTQRCHHDPTPWMSKRDDIPQRVERHQRSHDRRSQAREQQYRQTGRERLKQGGSERWAGKQQRDGLSEQRSEERRCRERV